MRRVPGIAVVMMLVAGFASAEGPANDVGIAVSPGATMGPGAPIGQGVVCPPPGQATAAFTGNSTQDGRLFRDAIPSVCPSKVYPGQTGVGTTFNYETFTYPNTSAASACVTVNFNPDTVAGTPCTANAHASAYLTSYDPTNQALNFVGDVGSSLTQPFSFEVPAATSMVLVVTNTIAAAICDFGFEIVNLPCSTAVEAELALVKSVAPGTVPPGGNAVFTLTVTNNGPGSAENTVVTDTLPAGLTYVSNDCGAGFAAPTLTWNVGTLANAASATCNVTVTVDQAGSFTNGALATSDGTDATPANNSAAATVNGQPVIVEVPTLSAAGLAVMLLGLGLAAFWVLRRN
ncbi:MAG: hypothetical protein ABIV06_05330 [Thermoanaerobaculia bacterium]